MRFGLRAKFILLISLVLLVVIGVAAAVMLSQNVRSLRSGIRTDVKSFANLATKPIGDTYVIYRDGGEVRVHLEIQRFTDLDPNITNVSVSDINGNILFSDNKKIAKISEEQATSFDPIYLTASDGTLTRAIAPYIEDNGAHRYTLIYDVSNADVITTIRRATELILLLGFGALLLSAILTYLLVRQLFLTPLVRVRTVALAIAAGQLDQQVTIKRNDEVGDLAKAVNAMASSLQADIKKLQELDKLKSEFMMIASHNLRTPLSVMEGYMDIFNNRKNDPETEKYLHQIQAQLSTLKQFAEDMIAISGIEVGQKISHIEAGELTKVVADTSQIYKMKAEAKGLQYSVELPEGPIRMQLSPQHLGMALGNIIDNAVKFTAQGEVKVTLAKFVSHVEIVVSDSGIGIKPSEQVKLFTKFHRGTSTLEYDYNGLGIGLYLSKLIIGEHGGTIRYEPRSSGGSRFVIRLPLAGIQDPQLAV